MLVVGLATESSSSHTSKIERQQELCFCFAPGGKEDRDDEVCKHTRAVIVADAYRMQRGVYDTTSSNVLAIVSNGSKYRTILKIPYDPGTKFSFINILASRAHRKKEKKERKKS